MTVSVPPGFSSRRSAHGGAGGVGGVVVKQVGQRVRPVQQALLLECGLTVHVGSIIMRAMLRPLQSRS